MRPFMLCDFISDGIMRLFRLNDPKALDETVTEEGSSTCRRGRGAGCDRETERDTITNILDFNDTTVSEVMTHRTDICAVSESATIEDVRRSPPRGGLLPPAGLPRGH